MWLCLHFLLCLSFILPNINCALRPPFSVLWNVPSHVCQDKYNISLNLKQYEIIANDNQNFEGNNIVIFYETRPGLYPKYLTNGSAVNGGLPQRVPLMKHFQKSESDITDYIPNVNFSGLSVVDWESWRPIFDRNEYEENKHIYMEESEKLVRDSHPTWDKSQVKKKAKKEFESAARDLMEGTLKLGRKLRANGLWGFYGFPRCFNYDLGQNYCTNDTILFNNQLHWMWSASSALYPSIYLTNKMPAIDRKLRVQGILNETIRVQKMFANDTPAFAYSLFRYRTKEFYIKEDLKNTIGQAFDAGLDGIVLWDSSSSLNNKSQCSMTKQFLDSILGPLIKSVIDYASLCSHKLCTGHGKCMRKSWYWKQTLFSQLEQEYISFDNYKCRCYKNWAGANCDRHS